MRYGPTALRIDVTNRDQKILKKLLASGLRPVRVVLRALALLQMAKSVSAPRTATVVPLTGLLQSLRGQVNVVPKLHELLPYSSPSGRLTEPPERPGF